MRAAWRRRRSSSPGSCSSCDSTPMNVSRTASRRRASVTSRMTTMVASGGPAAAVLDATGYVASSIQRSGSAVVRSSTGPLRLPSLAGKPSGIVELPRISCVGAFLDVGEDRLAGRVGQLDRAVGCADDHGLAHRPDHGVQLGGARVLRFGQPLQPDLGFDPIADVASDRDDHAGPARQVDRLQDDLDRDRSVRRPARSRASRSTRPRRRRPAAPRGPRIAPRRRHAGPPRSTCPTSSSRGRSSSSAAPRFASTTWQRLADRTR